MKRMTLRVLAAVLVTLPQIVAAERPVVNIGIALDGDLDLRQLVIELLQPEVDELTRAEFDVRIPYDKMVQGDATLDGVRDVVDRLLRDDDVQIIVTAGAIGSHVAASELANRGPLPKPVIAPFVLDADLQRVPLDGAASGIENLNYVAFPSDPRADLREFRQTVPFSSVALVLNHHIAAAIPGLEDYYLAAAREAGLDARIVLARSVDGVLADLPAEVDAALVALPLHFPEGDIERLARGFIERGLPSFSSVGTRHVEAGIMVGLHADRDLSRLARRVALNLHRILLGEDAGSLPVVFQRSDQLTINMATARAMGIYPSWTVVNEAVQIEERVRPLERELTLVSSVREAIRANLDLEISRRAVAAGEAQVRQAKSTLLPQVDLDAMGAVVDDGLAGPFQAERTLTGTTTLSQLIYSDAAWANYGIEQNLQGLRQQEREQVRLDIAQEAATAYLNVLRAKTLERVQKHNLQLTRSNLELARVRQRIGVSGPAEVYRWDSQMAIARNNAIQANTQRNLAEIVLNQVLHRPLEESFATRETGLYDESLVTHDPRFIRFIDNKRNFGVFRSFMATEALEWSPELRGLDAAIAARERALQMAERAHYLPTLALQADATRNLSREGIGSEMPALGGDANWTVGVNAAFPLYRGGGKFAAARQAREELAQLQIQRQAVAERVEQRIRAALHVAGAAYAGIGLSNDAAVAASRNLELVKDAYRRGIVSILDLLDAQNAAIVAEEGAANSVYDFLVDEMEVERSVGYFYFFATPEQAEEWFARADAYLDSAFQQQTEE